MMMFPGWAFILFQLWALQEVVSLSVQQWPLSVTATQGDKVSLSCRVTQSQASERLRVEWSQDDNDFCLLLVSNGSLNPVGCGSRGQLFWEPPGNFTLQLDRVSLNDSGNYVCRATLEIPEWQKAKGNGTEVVVKAGDPQRKETFSQLGLLVLLVAGGVVAALVLGAALWGLSRCHREDSENSFYSNVLYRPRVTTHRPEARFEDKARGQRAEVVYSAAFPKPALH